MLKVRLLLKFGKYAVLPVFAIAGFIGYCISEHNFLLLFSPIIIFMIVGCVCDTIHEKIINKYPAVDIICSTLLGFVRELPKLFKP